MERLLRRDEVERVTGMSRSWIYAAMQRGEFPTPVRLTKRAVGWRESDIEIWVESRRPVNERVSA